MEELKVQYCKLCLTIINDENYVSIENDTKEVLGVLLLNVDFNSERNHVMCSICSTRLFAAKEFLLTCSYTNNVVTTYAADTTILPLDFRDIYMKETASEHLSDDIRICRLCMQPIGSISKCKQINVEQVDMIHKFVPEMDIFVIKDPIMCKLCLESLAEHCKFLKKCSEAERNIGNFSDGQVPAVPSPAPSLNITVKVEKVDCEFEEDVPELIKTECLDIDCDEIKIESDQNQEFFPEPAVKNIRRAKHQPAFKRIIVHEGSSRVHMFKCETCDFKCKLRTTLKLHLQKHKDPSEVQMYKCEICNFETNHPRYLKRHVMSMHEEPLQLHKCQNCNYETMRRKNLKSHMLIHKDPSEIKMHKCEICEYRTKYKVHLKSHTLKHKDPSTVPMYKCEHCEFETKYKAHMKNHRLLHKDASEVEMHKCGVCDYETRRKKDLTMHMIVHKDPSEVQMFKCQHCDYETMRKRNLKKHMLIHIDPSQIQMFKCEHCSYETKYNTALRRHLLVHKDPSKIKMYKCEVCDFETKHRLNLKSHTLLHKDASELKIYKCEICVFEAKCKRNLSRHMIMHRDPSQLYTCKICNFQSKYHTSLKRHMLIHRYTPEIKIDN